MKVRQPLRSLAAIAALFMVTQLTLAPMHSATAASPATSKHTVYVAVAGARDARFTQSSVSDAYVRDVVKAASAKWQAESGGRISFSVKRIVRYTSSIPCHTSQSLDIPWYNEASKEFTSANRATYFGPGTKRHLLVLTPDGTTGFGPCEQATYRELTGRSVHDASTLGAGINDGGSSHAFVGRKTNDPSEIFAILGRNMGFDFPGVQFCSSAARLEGVSVPGAGTTPSCLTDSRADSYDPRDGESFNERRVLSVPAQFRAGFISAADVPLVDIGDESSVTRTFVVSALGTRTGVRGVRVVDPVSGETYWVEYRATSGADHVYEGGYWFPSTDNSSGGQYRYYTGQGVRVIKEDFANSSAPESLALTSLRRVGATNYRNLVMRFGDGFSSYSGGVHIDVNWTDGSLASVTVTAVSTPTLAAMPAGVLVGDTFSYRPGESVSMFRPNFRQLGVTYAYRWYLDGVLQPSATTADFATPTSLTGHTLRGEVVASLPGFASATDSTGDFVIGEKQLSSSAATLTIVRSDGVNERSVGSAGKTSRVTVLADRTGTFVSDGAVSLQVSRDGVPVGTAITAPVDAWGVAHATIPALSGPGTYVVTATRNDFASASMTITVPRDAALVWFLPRGQRSLDIPFTVSGNGTTAPTGTVELWNGSSLVSTTTLVPGEKSAFTVSRRDATSSSLRLVYSGDQNYREARSLR